MWDVGVAKRMRFEEGEEQAGAAGHSNTSAFPPRTRLPGHSLVDLIGRGNDLHEEHHMQPAVMKLLQAAATALGSVAHLEDTHKASNRLSYHHSQPDVTCVAAPGNVGWAVVVWTGEFKLSVADIAKAIGQQIKRVRFIFDGQGEQRQYTVSLILTLKKLPLEGILVTSTGQVPFSVSTQSPGFRWLVRLLLTPRFQLGYCEPAVPRLSAVGQMPVSSLQLIRRGTTQGSGSFVWRCEAAAGEAILKLNRDEREARVPPICLHHITSLHCSHMWHCGFTALSVA